MIADGEGRRFNPGHGRLMKEWATVRPADEESCRAYALEARDFVAALAKAPG